MPRVLGLISNLISTLFQLLNIRVPARTSRLIDLWIKKLIDLSLYLLGPLLISLASVIIICLTYSFSTIIIPLKCPEGNIFCLQGILHVCAVVFFDVNIIFNYAMCVLTKNTGDKHQKVVRELANATGYAYPQNEQEVQNAKREYQEVRKGILIIQEWCGLNCFLDLFNKSLKVILFNDACMTENKSENDTKTKPTIESHYTCWNGK